MISVYRHRRFASNVTDAFAQMSEGSALFSISHAFSSPADVINYYNTRNCAPFRYTAKSADLFLELVPVSGYTNKMKCKKCGGKIRIAFG